MKLGLVVAACALLFSLGAGSAEGPRRPASVRTELIDGRVFLPVDVNGVATVALLDSAAAESVIDDDFARRLGIRDPCDSAARAGSGPATIEEQMLRGLETHVSVHIGLFGYGRTVPHRELGTVGDAAGQPVDFLVGGEIFAFLAFRMDVAGNSLSLLRNKRRAGMRLQTTRQGRHETFPIEVGAGAEAAAVLDTGRGPVSIGRDFAARAGLIRSENHAAADQVVIPRLALGGRTFDGVVATIDPAQDAADLSIGTSMLRHFIITTDFAQRAVWLEPRQ